MALRFLTGVGLGGAMPNAITLTSEYCPTSRRSSLVTLMFCGFTVGSALAGIVASRFLPAFGWRAMLGLGGLLPLLLVGPLARVLPESARYLASHGASAARVAAVLRRMLPGVDVPHADSRPRAEDPLSPVVQLFQPACDRRDLLLWPAFFMSLLVVYLLSSWLPTLITSSGFTLGQASLITAMFQVGGTVGAVAIGRLMDAWNPHYVLGLSFAAATAFVAGLGHASAQPWLLSGLVFGAGFGVSGSQVGANALAAAFYPTTSRATGVGWALAVGRLGSILGSVLGGVMLSRQWGLPTLYGVVAIPPLIAGAAIVVSGTIQAHRGVPTERA